MIPYIFIMVIAYFTVLVYVYMNHFNRIILVHLILLNDNQVDIVDEKIKTYLYVLQKKHECQVCLKLFRSPADLKTHTYTHTGERPHFCPYCSYRAAQKGNLNVHIKTLHKDVNHTFTALDFL